MEIQTLRNTKLTVPIFSLRISCAQLINYFQDQTSSIEVMEATLYINLHRCINRTRKIYFVSFIFEYFPRFRC